MKRLMTVASSVSFSAAAGRYFETIRLDFNTVRPRDTWIQAAQTLKMHVFE